MDDIPMNIPNTPAELAAMASKKPSSPYADPRVQAAMRAIGSDKGCDLAHVQALAEICISTLRDNYEQMLDGTNDEEVRAYYSAMIMSLLGAEALVERANFISDYVDD